MENETSKQENCEQSQQTQQPESQSTNQFYQPEYNNTQFQVLPQENNQPQQHQPQPQTEPQPQSDAKIQNLGQNNGIIVPNNLWMQIDHEDKDKDRKDKRGKHKTLLLRKSSFWDNLRLPSCRIRIGIPVKTLQTSLGFLSTFAVLVIMIALLIYHFGEKDLKLSSVSGGLNYISFNLNSDPIIDLIAGNPVCPTGYETIHLGRWPGTETGCSCPLSGVKEGFCEAKEELICSDVSDIDEIDMFSFDGSAWCAKRAQINVDYVKAVTCPGDYQQCSPGICMKNSLSCPITSVTLKSTGDDASKKLGTSGRYITVTRKQGKSPLIDLDISLNDLPCFSMNEIPSGGGDYVLLKRKPDGCGSYGVDTLFSAEIDQTTEDQIFNSNLFPSTVLDLPEYRKVFQVTKTILAARGRITVANNQMCLTIDTQVISEASDAADSLNRYVSGTAITAMIIHGLLFLYVFFAAYTMIQQNSLDEVLSGKDSFLWIMVYIPLGLMELIVFIVMTALVSSARNTMKESTNYLMTLDQAGCFPSDPPNNVIGDYDDLVDQTATKLHSFSMALLFITLISYIFVVGVFMFRKYR